MEKKEKIIFQEEAKQSLRNIAIYIEEKSYPETSERYIQRMLDFVKSLAVFPNKYSLCRFIKFAKRKLHCAVFEHTYIFAYKVVKNRLIIYNVIHSKALK